MTKITILGAGVMGSALSVPLTDNGHQVNLVGSHLDGDIIAQICEDHVHPGLRVQLADSVQPYSYDRLGEALDGSELVVVGVNSLGIDWAAMMLGDLLPADVPLLFLTKGLEGRKTHLEILPHALRNELPAHLQTNLRMAAIGGPSIAGELASRRHSCVVATADDPALLAQLTKLLRTPYYHLWTSTDLIGVEVCVALKNIYALAVGMAAGFMEKEQSEGDLPANEAAMHNLAAAIFAQGLWEMAYLVEYMGGELKSVYSLPGAGDLYVTCQDGYNNRMGRLLGMGIRYIDAKVNHMPTDTVEGAELALAIGPTVEQMVYEGTLDGSKIPLLRAMVQVVCNDEAISVPWDEFFS